MRVWARRFWAGFIADLAKTSSPKWNSDWRTQPAQLRTSIFGGFCFCICFVFWADFESPGIFEIWVGVGGPRWAGFGAHFLKVFNADLLHFLGDVGRYGMFDPSGPVLEPFFWWVFLGDLLHFLVLWRTLNFYPFLEASLH